MAELPKDIDPYGVFGLLFFGLPTSQEGEEVLGGRE
jgi:hypothetical protein